MQARGALPLKTNERIRALIGAVGELTRFQVAVIGTLLVLIALGAVVAYVQSRPREISIKESKNMPVGGQRRLLSVHVAGAVAKPGLYRLEEGSRVADALSTAGGATPDGILDDVNLASRLKDGEKILVPRSSGQGSAPGAVQQSSESTLINVNTADESELDKLQGIGPSLAKRIVEYRRKNGPFPDIEELDNVDGIGPKKLEMFKGQVTI